MWVRIPLGALIYKQNFRTMFEKLLRKKSPAVITTSPTNLATLLILTMTAELQQAEQTTGMLVPVIDDVKASYNRLLKLGMGSTQNALVLRQQIESHEDGSLNIAKAQGLIDFVKKCRLILDHAQYLCHIRLSRTFVNDINLKPDF